MKASQVNDQYVDLLRTATPATPSHNFLRLPYFKEKVKENSKKFRF